MYEHLIRNATAVPGMVALEQAGRAVTYRELADLATAVGAGMRARGIAPGHSVGVMLPNVPEMAAVVYGAAMAGAVTVPLNVLLAPPELRFVVEDCAMRMLIVHERLLPVARAAVAELADPPELISVGGAGAHGTLSFQALCGQGASFAPAPLRFDTHVVTIYTSGTTGKPKGAMISAGNVEAQLEMMRDRFQPGEGERALCVLPLFHAFGLNGLLHLGVLARGTLVLHPRFELESCAQSLARDDVAWFAGVPTMFAYLAAHPDASLRFPALRYCVSGGAPLPAEVQRAFGARYGVPIYEGYGLSETTVSVCANGPGAVRRGSVGRPYRGVEVRVVDETGAIVPQGTQGELLLRGANVMLGYLNRPEETREALKDGWFKSGDLGYVDRDGFVFVVDRKKDVIIKGGYKICPREVEDVLRASPDVADVAVVGVPDPIKGEEILAVVHAKKGAADCEAALRSHVEKSLARYKWPRHYELCDELPRNATGKVLKGEIRHRWRTRMAPEAAIAS